MKTLLLFITNLFFLTSLSSQSYIDKKGKQQLWGKVNIEELTKGDFKEWYDKNLEDFETNLTKKDGKLFKEVKVKVFIGTWCGDTKYLLPKFVKCWESMGLDMEDLDIIALHREDKLYKQGPDNETAGLNIHRVPTFIFEKDGEEMGRIVERTVFDLDRDIKAISLGHAYEERYQAVAILNEYFLEVDQDSLLEKSTLNKAYRKVRREVSSSSELNTYAYVLLTEKKSKQAEFVFKLNRYLFPYNPRSRDSYGEILYENGKLEESKLEYLEVLRLKPDSNNAISQLALINEELEKENEVH